MAELPIDTHETPTFDAHDKKKSHNLLRQFIRSSMQNMESVAQKIAELPLDAPETPLLTPLTKKKSNLFCIICQDSQYELPCKIWSL